MKELIQQIIVDKLLQITVLNAFTIDQWIFTGKIQSSLLERLL